VFLVHDGHLLQQVVCLTGHKVKLVQVTFVMLVSAEITKLSYSSNNQSLRASLFHRYTLPVGDFLG